MKRVGRGAAPGRLDFLGGVADYSGSRVLEMPIRWEAMVEVRPLKEDRLELESFGREGWAAPAAPFLDTIRQDAAAARAALDKAKAPQWARYPLGCLWTFSRAKGPPPAPGLSFAIRSWVPEGMGVSSSAALEVATLRALGDLVKVRWEDRELAHLGREAENEIVGAPCGLMDQLTATHGENGALLPIECRPDSYRPLVPLPPGVTVVGWPSGVKHAVSGSPYAAARTATFMGKKMFETALGRRWDYAAEIPPWLFAREASRTPPESITGRTFKRRFGLPDDPLSRVLSASSYRVRDALAFPIEENQRSALAESLLSDSRDRGIEERLRLVGELMLQSHSGYTSLGLGSPETDRIVDALVSQRRFRGVYGARISGGGSGGTVVILLRKGAVHAVKELAERLGGIAGGRLIE